MSIYIREIKNDNEEIKLVKNFLFNQIMKEYGIGPTPKFHYDILSLEKYYINPERNNFFVAFDDNKVVATSAIRAYDKDYEFFKGKYSSDNTASIWRLMVDEKYRRQGLARQLVSVMEEFASKNHYGNIYLHTHRYLDAAIPFWKSVGYIVTVEEDDYDETTHMLKNIH